MWQIFTTVECRISSRLIRYKNYKNRLRLAKVIVKNKLPRFLWFTVYISTLHCVSNPKPSTDIVQCWHWSQWSSGNMPDCSLTRPTSPVVFITTTTAIYSLEDRLHSFTAVPRSTQPSTIRGTVEWVSALKMSNNKWRWWMWMVAAYRRTHSLVWGLAATRRSVCMYQMSRVNSRNGLPRWR